MAIVELVPVKKTQEERLADFATHYATNGGDYVEAYSKAGFSSTTAGVNAKKYLDKNHEYVFSIVRKTMGQDASKFRIILNRCIEDDAIPWNHRLKAMEMAFKNMGIHKDVIVIESNNAEELSEKERKAEIRALMKKMESYA